MEYQCKPFTTSSSISAFSTGITQRIVVYSKKNKNKTKQKRKACKKTERKTKRLHFDISDFSSSSSNNCSMWESE